MKNETRTELLRVSAREIFNCTLRALDASQAVKRAVKIDSSQLVISHHSFSLYNRPVYSIAIGKAAVGMASGLAEILGDRLSGGVLTGPRINSPTLAKRWVTYAGGHPLPNQASLDAAKAAFKLLLQADQEKALVVFLISGGGSAMIEWPRSDAITLADLQETNRQLVSCGASIAEINTVRAAFSRVKGGELARLAPKTQQVSLIISDTNPGDLASVASGPTFRGNVVTNALEVVQKYQLSATLPPSVLASIETFVSPPTDEPAPAFVILDNQSALEAAAHKARELGFAATIASDLREQLIDEGVELLIERFHEVSTSASQPVCLISGGEFSCPLRGDGKGGRNSETVLRCVIELRKRKIDAVVLSAGTDGIDGNSRAAGAIGDQTTIARATELGLAAQEFLDNSDSFGFFDRLGDTIVTGVTGTNVRDVRLILV